MAQSNDLQSLVESFVSQIQSHIARQIESELAGKIDAFKASLLGGTAPSAAPRGRPAVALKAPGRRGPRSGYEAEEKPCPVCGKMNKARRFSYLCEDHRTEENKRKFKGSAGKGGAAKAGAAKAVAPKAAAPAPAASKPAAAAPKAAGKPGRPPGKRGPGRPKGSKNKPKTETPASA